MRLEGWLREKSPWPQRFVERFLQTATGEYFSPAALCDEAGIGPDQKIVVDIVEGVVTIRTLEAAAKADSDATILRLLRLMNGSEQERKGLIRRPITFTFRGTRYAGLITGSQLASPPSNEFRLDVLVATGDDSYEDDFLTIADIIRPSSNIEIDLDAPPPASETPAATPDA